MPQVAFLIGGMQKAGTSALARYLRAHPSLRLPAGKEAHVFDMPAFDDTWSTADIDALYVPHLAAGASGNYGLGALNKVIIDLDGGHVLVSAIGSGAVLGVVTDTEAKLGNIAYEMTVFANRAGAALSPQLVLELKNSVGAASAR